MKSVVFTEEHRAEQVVLYGLGQPLVAIVNSLNFGPQSIRRSQRAKLLSLVLDVLQSLVGSGEQCRKVLFELGIQQVLLGIIENHKQNLHHQT